MSEFTVGQQVLITLVGSGIAITSKEIIWDILTKRRLASALCAELRTAKELFLLVTDGGLKSWDKMTNLPRFVIKENYFIAYDGNTGKLGLFSQNDVDKIVRTYGVVKAFAEDLRYWSNCLDRFARSTTFHQTSYDFPEPYITFYKEQFPPEMKIHYDKLIKEQDFFFQEIDSVIDLLHVESLRFGKVREEIQTFFHRIKQIEYREKFILPLRQTWHKIWSLTWLLWRNFKEQKLFKTDKNDK